MAVPSRSILFDPTHSPFDNSENLVHYLFHRQLRRPQRNLIALTLDDLFDWHLWSYDTLDQGHPPPWNLVKKDFFKPRDNAPNPLARDPETVKAFDRWAKCTDASFQDEQPSLSVFKDAVAFATYDLESIIKVRGVTEELVDKIVEAFEYKDIVVMSAPPGYGKTSLSVLVSKRLAKNKALNHLRNHDQSAITRHPSSFTKTIHLVPNPSNAGSVTNFLRSKLRDHAYIAAVTVQSPMTEEMRYEGTIDYVYTPYDVGERVLIDGRFRLVVIDEAHLSSPSITLSILRALRGMIAPPTTDRVLNVQDTDSKRIDKLLILLGVEEDRTQHYIERIIGLYTPLTHVCLSYPTTPHLWNASREDVHVSVCLGKDNPNLDRLHYIPRTIAVDLNKTAQEIDDEDKKFDDSAYCKAFPEEHADRIATCVKAMMKKSKFDAYLHRNKMGEEKWEENLHPFMFANILIFAPSSAAAKAIFNRLRFCIENKLKPYPNSDGFIEMFRFSITASLVDEETPLTTSDTEFPEVKRISDDSHNLIANCDKFVKGKVMIVVNGCETGLTIDNVKYIVESGVERVLEGYSRSGIERHFFVLSDRDQSDQRIKRGGRTRETSVMVALGAAAAARVKRRKDTVVIQRATQAISQGAFAKLIDEKHIRDCPIFTKMDHREALTEARVTGTMMENIGVGGVAEFTLNPLAKLDSSAFSSLDPYLAKMLRAYVGSGMPAFGVIAVALAHHKIQGIRKPIAYYASRFGPTTRLNTLDLFKKALSAMPHKDQKGIMRAITEWREDTNPLLVLHLQLIVASGWDLKKPVPTRQEVVQATPDQHNFWAGWFNNCQQPCQSHPSLRDRLDWTQAPGSPSPIEFLYGYLIPDEERRDIWATYRSIAFSMVADGLIHDVNDLHTNIANLNTVVLNITTAPIFTERGRALSNVIQTAFCTRTCDTDLYKKHGKARGIMKEYYRDPRDPWGATPPSPMHYVERTLRADSGWPVHSKEVYLRYACSSTYNEYKDDSDTEQEEDENEETKEAPEQTDVPVENETAEKKEEEKEQPMTKNDLIFTLLDPITLNQAALFLNASGKWRIYEEPCPDAIPPKFAFLKPKMSYYVEIELNGRNALIGTKIKIGNRDDEAQYLGQFRMWIHKNLSIYREDCRPGSAYYDALTEVARIWRETSPQMRDPAPLNGYSYMKD